MNTGSALDRYAFGPEKTKDGSARDPIGTVDRARQSLHRAKSLSAPPEWWDGTLDEYRAALTGQVTALYGTVPDGEPVGFDYFSTDGKNFSRLTAAKGERRNLFRKDVIRVGEFHHPKHSEPIVFTKDRLQSIADATNDLIRQGVKIPATLRHNRDPLANVGFWDALAVNEQGEMVGTLRVEDEAVLPKIGKTLTDVSVGIATDVKAPDGSVKPEALDHIAITLFPVVAGGKNFEPALLGLDRESGPSLYATKPTPSTEKQRMDPLAKIKAKLNLSADATDEDVEAALAKVEDEKNELERKLTEEQSGKGALLDRLGNLEADKIEREMDEWFDTSFINDRQKPSARAILSAKPDSGDGKVTLFDKDGKPDKKSVADAFRAFVNASTPWTVDMTRRMSGKIAELSKDAESEEIAEWNRITEYEAESIVKSTPGSRIEWSKDEDGRKTYQIIVPRD